MTATTHILAREREYRIEQSYEDAFLVWDGGKVSVGDHYGDPTCAIINAAGWCVTGGEGLLIARFGVGLPSGSNSGTPKLVDLWRRENPPPFGRDWPVENMWLVGSDVIRVLVDPIGEHAGLYEVNVTTLAYSKI